MGSENFYEFAENDFYGIKKSIEAEIFFTGMSSTCQNICERYLKYIIETCVQNIDKDSKEYTFIMRTHSLKNLCSFISKNLPDSNFNKAKICQADGYYFSSRYPGKDSFIADKDDILLCWEAIKYCKECVDDYISSHNKK